MRVYVLVLGVGLLVEGGGLLLLDRLGIPADSGTSDAGRNVLYFAWGIALVGISITARGHAATRVIWAALVFGSFYVAMAVLGLTIERPFGLLLGPGENIFHFMIGSLALVLGAWALKTTTDRAVLPARLSAPQRRRRPSVERKRTSRRGRSRRR
jgi:hypothetical protein